MTTYTKVTDAMVEDAYSAYWEGDDTDGNDRPHMRRAIEAALSASPAQAVDLDAVRECLGEIADLSTALRHGGPAPEDLHGLSDALEEAISIAYDMCKIIDQQAGRDGRHG